MAEDPRILTFSVPLVSGTTTHFRIQFGSDLEDWTLLKIGGATDLAVALLTGRTYVLDGVNATDDDNNNKAAASTPPNWYRVQLKSASGYGAWGEPFVFPSLADFLHNLRHQLQDPALIGGTDLLPAEAYRMRVQSAIEAFERVQPRETSQLFSLTSGDYTYSLPDEWATGYSRVSRIEYPADETPRRFYKPDAVFADEQQSEWRFRRISPGESETARLYFRTRHKRDGSSIPASYFQSVLLWAVGDCAEALRLKYTQFGDFTIGADYTDPGKERLKSWADLAKTAKAQAEKMWGQPATGVRARVPHYEDHGRIPDSVRGGW
jgi:hypothetical protein